jgi:protein import protein ZIM17
MSLLRTFRSFERTFEQTFRANRSGLTLRNAPSNRAFSIPTRQCTIASSPFNKTIRRHNSTDESPETRAPRPLTDRTQQQSPEDVSTQQQSDADSIAMRKALSPAYQLWFTCKKCLERSGHTISKQAYHFGTCVINCPKCKSQHLISDNLKIFTDKNMTLEDIAKEHGQYLRKGKLGANGDIEFYKDQATKTVMEAQAAQEEFIKKGQVKDG